MFFPRRALRLSTVGAARQRVRSLARRRQNGVAAIFLSATCVFTTVPALSQGVSATGSDGVTVTLPQAAQRVVALAPHLAENLFAAGAGHTLVATVEYSDYPPAAQKIPRIGGYNSLSIEAIVARRPDLVLAWGSGTGSDIIQRLRGLGIAVYSDEIRRLTDIPDSLRALGQLTGSNETAQRSAHHFEQALAALRDAHADAAALGVFYQIWHDPLQTIGGEHLISEVMALCGGRNIFEDARGLAPRISRESVLLRDPDVIVASGSSESVAAWLSRWRDMPGLRAVQSEALYVINPDLIERPTPRLLRGARQLCERLDRAREALG